MKAKRTLFLLCLILSVFFIASCSDDNDDNNTDKDKTEIEKQIEGIVSALDKESELSSFKEELKNIDTKDLKDKEFTILAYKNGATGKAGKPSVQDSIRNAKTMRHMIAGRHTVEQLKTLKKLVALSKDTLYIKYEDNKLFVNGVQLGKSIVADKSIVFVVDEKIPVMATPTPIVPEKAYMLKITDVLTGNAVKDATVSFYNAADSTLISESTTDALGMVKFVHRADEEVLYEAVHLNSFNTYNGLIVIGIFKTQAEINNAPVYHIDRKMIGGLIYQDINQDGVINSQDKISFMTLTEEQTEVYIVPATFAYPDEDPSFADIAKAYGNMSTLFWGIDNNLSDINKRKETTAGSKGLSDFWDEAYKTINMSNILLANDTLKSANKAMLLQYSASAYFRLATVFGGVPIAQSSKSDIARSSLKETYKYAESRLRESLGSMPHTNENFIDIYLDLAQVYRVQAEKQEGLYWAEKALSSGQFALSAFSDSTSSATPVKVIQLHLLAAELNLETGKTIEALRLINMLYMAEGTPTLPNSASIAEIRAAIRNYYSGNERGVKYLNIQSWRLNDSWENHKLLPIPLSAFDKNGLLTQNPGY